MVVTERTALKKYHLTKKSQKHFRDSNPAQISLWASSNHKATEKYMTLNHKPKGYKQSKCHIEVTWTST